MRRQASALDPKPQPQLLAPLTLPIHRLWVQNAVDGFPYECARDTPDDKHGDERANDLSAVVAKGVGVVATLGDCPGRKDGDAKASHIRKHVGCVCHDGHTVAQGAGAVGHNTSKRTAGVAYVGAGGAHRHSTNGEHEWGWGWVGGACVCICS